MIGDAPIQGCDWNALVVPIVQSLIDEAAGIPLEIHDFRRTSVSNFDMVGGVERDRRPLERYVQFDLGGESLLEPISTRRSKFRVTMYDPRLLASTHQPGTHQYLICREFFEADVVLNLPKLKTHRKAGITGALKNLVGLNGHKEYLPHHRAGGSALGGDSYSGFAPLKRGAEFLLDHANRNIGRRRYVRFVRLARTLMRIHRDYLKGDPEIEGGWYGNDTVWRMVADLNRIAMYGRSDGTLAETRQRTVWSLTDSIVAGVGDGPLAPRPARLGVVTFSSSPVAAEVAHCALLRLDPRRIPLVREAFGQFRWPLVPSNVDFSYRLNGMQLTHAELAQAAGIDALPAPAWVGHVEDETARQGITST